MKKLWLLLALLLALIICCVWCHTNKIHSKQAAAVPSATPNPAITTDEVIKAIETKPEVIKKPIEFTIEHNKEATNLNGIFGHVKQELALTEAFTNKGNINSKVELSRFGNLEIVDKIKTLLPTFLSEFDSGSIHYKDKQLTVNGDTPSADTKTKFDNILSGLGIDFVNHTKVMQKVKKPIEFTISQAGQTTDLHGTFANEEQSNALIALIANKGSINPTIEAGRLGTLEAVEAVKMIWSNFVANFSNRKVVYTDEKLSIEGQANSKEAQEKFNQLLGTINGVDISNSTTLKVLEESKPTLTQTEKKAITEITEMLKVENIEFQTNKSQLTQKGSNTVNKLKDILAKYQDVGIMLAGHTDSDGDETYNLNLSEKRVQQVRTTLIKLGIDGVRMKAKGYGESKPLVPNDSSKNKAKNRRVEVTILKGE